MKARKVPKRGTYLFMIIICVIISGACNGRPPVFSVSNPRVITVGAGGIVIAYQVSDGNDKVSFVRRLGPLGNALWGEKGIRLGSNPPAFSSQGEFAVLIGDGQGTATVVYSSDGDIWAQKLDGTGHSLWPAGEVRVSRGEVRTLDNLKAVTDGNGGVITAWASVGGKLYLQGMDSNGNRTWQTEVSGAGLDRFDIASDDNGNAFVVWKDNAGYGSGDIFVQKVQADGGVAWGTGGVRLTGKDSPGFVMGNVDQWVLGDGSGGAIVAWIAGVIGNDGGTIIGQELHVQRINAVGDGLWVSGGIVVGGPASQVRLVRVSEGGVFVFWNDAHTVFAQSIDTSGKLLWPEDGVVVCQTGNVQEAVYYDASRDDDGGAVLVWNVGRSLRAQRMAADGTPLWDDSGIEVSSASSYWAGYSTPARISPDDTGSFVISWAEGKRPEGKTSSYVQRVDAKGKRLWGDGVTLSP